MFANSLWGVSVGGMFSDEFLGQPWSWAKFMDFLNHIWIPVLVLAVGSTAGLIRTVRANLLDQLEMPYVVTARAKGPVRVAAAAQVSRPAGHQSRGQHHRLDAAALGLRLSDRGAGAQPGDHRARSLLRALMDQDMFLAGSFIMMLSFLTVIGTLISDILLAWVDPRIRFESKHA